MQTTWSMHGPELVADRFVVMDGGRVVDFATGDTVVLTITSACGYAEQTRWMARCDTLHRLHHPALARLVDCLALGESQRFEAWRGGAAWTGAHAEAIALKSRNRDIAPTMS